MNSMPLQSSVQNEIKTNTGMDINQRWMELKKIILNSAQDHTGHERKEDNEIVDNTRYDK